MSLVRLDDVSLAYGEQKLLVHVGFEIEAGERVCLIGRNGTGKTSLFRLITGIVQLNQRPRETLGFDTPANKLQARVASIG
jgi:ATPase subunit of ABC transporter with duplicated ATPase domains